jgi:hypothetical protein
VKRDELLWRARRAARKRGIEWTLVRQGADHEIWQCGSTRVVIPRHREINEGTAFDVQRRLEAELGKEWWHR